MAGELAMATPQTSIQRGSALSLQIALSALLGFLVTLLWAVTGADYFWPGWVWLGLAIGVGVHVVLLRALSAPPDPFRALRIHAEATALITGIYLAVWALAGGGDFWPVWPLSVFITALAVHGIVVWQRRAASSSSRIASTSSPARGAARLTCRRPSCGGSSATCTTARRPGSWP
jgi:hypothetical protein